MNTKVLKNVLDTALLEDREMEERSDREHQTETICGAKTNDSMPGEVRKR